MIPCPNASAPDTGNGYNKFLLNFSLNLAGNLLRHTSQVIPTTWIEAIEMPTKVRAAMESSPTEITRDLAIMRSTNVWEEIGERLLQPH